MKRPPKNNLPSASQPWGREIESSYIEIDSNLQRLERDVEVRAIAAGVDLLSAGIINLQSRQPKIMAGKNNIVLNSTPSFPGEYTWVDWIFVSKRVQTVILSGNVKVASPAGFPNLTFTTVMSNPPAYDIRYVYSNEIQSSTTDYTVSFNAAVDLGVGSYQLTCKLQTTNPYNDTSGTYSINMGVFPG